MSSEYFNKLHGGIADLAVPSTHFAALEAVNANTRKLATYDSVAKSMAESTKLSGLLNSTLADVAGLSALSTDLGRTYSALDSVAKTMADSTKLSGLLGLGLANPLQEKLNELARPMQGLTALSTDYGRTYSALDSVAKSMAESTKLSGLLGLGLENSFKERLNELARPRHGLTALSADIGRTYSALDSVAKSMAESTKLLGLLSSTLANVAGPSALNADFKRMYLGLDSVTKAMAGASKLSGLLGLEDSWRERLDELTRSSAALAALNAHGQKLATYDSVVNSTLTNVAGLSALWPREPFSHQKYPDAENGLVKFWSSLQTYESTRSEAREQDAFIQVLRGLNPVFPKLWIGAFSALHSGNPDWVRHVAISLRELLTHAMHFMAPDAEMESWISKPEQRSEKGRPTRAARIHFVIAPGIDSIDQKDASELKEILRLFEDLQERTHELENAVGTFEMNEFMLKTERFISGLARRHFAKKKLH